jgi:hypothetical protein
MARPRKSTALLELSGAFRKNPARRRARASEPAWNGPLGDPPAHFDGEQCKIWQELAQRSPAGVLARSDRAFFEILCGFMFKWRRGELPAGLTNLMWKMLRQAGIN